MIVAVNKMFKKPFLYRVKNRILLHLCCVVTDFIVSWSIYIIVHISTINNNYKELSFYGQAAKWYVNQIYLLQKSALRNILKVPWGTIMLDVVNNYKLYQLTFFSNTIFWMNLWKNCFDGIRWKFGFASSVCLLTISNSHFHQIIDQLRSVLATRSLGIANL